MLTIKLDEKKRAVIPSGKPRQVFAYTDNADGSITLTPVKEVVQEPFPRGSLIQEVEQWNREFAPMARKMKIPSPEE